MKKIKLLIASIIISTSFLVSTSVSAIDSSAPNVTRLAGQDRYQTCNKIVDSGWSQSNYAILVNSNMFADAITASPLAKKCDAPILLTESNNLTVSTKEQLQKLGVKTVYIVGGTGVISNNIEKTLKSMNITTKRLFGKDRFETSVNVAKELNDSKDVFVVSGDTFEDALSVAPIAAQLQNPIILVSKNTIPSSVKSYLNDKVVSLVGGTDVLSNNVSSALNPAKAYGQADKYSRNLALINDNKENLDLSKIFIASDSTFADALSGSALAGKNKNPIILLGNSNQSSISNFVTNNEIKTVNVLGGTGVVSDSAVSAITKNDSSSLSLDKIPDNTDLTEAQKNDLLSQLNGKWYRQIYLSDRNVTIPHDGKVLHINKNEKYQLVTGFKNDAQMEVIEKIKKISKDQYLFYGKDDSFEYSSLFKIDLNKNLLTLVYTISSVDNNKVSRDESFIRTDLASYINKALYIGKFKDANSKIYEFKDDLTALWPDKNFKYSLQQLDNKGISYIFTVYDSTGNAVTRYISEDQNDKRVFYSAAVNTEKWTDADPAYVKDKQLFVLTKIK